MQFGRTDHLATIDFTLPAQDPQNAQVLNQPRPAAPRVYLGAPVWGHAGFVGKIYPKGTRQRDFLKVYAKHFNCVELNSTYYSLPAIEQIHRWRDVVGPQFRFSPKFPQAISHEANPHEKTQLLGRFIETASAFGNRLGTSFLQLPPHFGPDNAGQLYALLEQLPTTFKTAVEFRHGDWFTDAVAFAEMKATLGSLGITALMTDTAGRRDVLHQSLTVPSAFVRFTGNNGHPTDRPRLAAWAQRVAAWLNSGLPEVYFYVHQPDETHSVDAAVYFARQLTQLTGHPMMAPQVIVQAVQQKLF